MLQTQMEPLDWCSECGHRAEDGKPGVRCNTCGFTPPEVNHWVLGPRDPQGRCPWWLQEEQCSLRYLHRGEHITFSSPVPEATERAARQQKIHNWCVAAFGIEQACSAPQCGLRMLEEAAELAQAVGVDLAQAHKLLDYVWSRPISQPFQELGELGLTVLALAAALGCNADAAEQDEAAHVLSKPLEHFTTHNQQKNDAGFLATPPALSTETKEATK